MRDSRQSTTSLLSNNSSLKKSARLSSYKNMYSNEGATDKPLPQILKQTIKKARELLIQKHILNENSLADREKMPTYDITDPLKNTPRELTLILVKQHDFLLHRVIALNETIGKMNASRHVGSPDVSHDLLKDIEAEETLSKQDVSIRSLKKENSFMKKQIESLKV